MISYLKGILTDIQKAGQKRIATVEVSQIGYDLQITPRFAADLPPLGERVHLFAHQQVREDQVILFGFGSRRERDLFRLLISVSGIGPQMGMALLDTLGFQDLVQAILTSNARVLSRAPGVGRKTAERLALELESKLSDWHQQVGSPVSLEGGPTVSIQEEVELMLTALGYTNNEIVKALQAVGRNTTLRKSEDPESWLREAITWLSTV